MSDLFKNRVYGVQIIKSKNSNYNADFTGAPRTLPDGTVYATDKVSKFNDRRYIGRNDDSLIFTKTTYKPDLKPMVLKEVFESHFGPISNHTKITALKSLLSKIDVRLFGATFAPKGADNMNLSIHGPVQISYGINRYEALLDSGMFTDQIGSPYASKEGADQTTLGSQTRSQEAHYVHHFSVNPKNLESYIALYKNTENDNYTLLSMEDIQQLKESMALATTYYDSTSKKDSENELLMWIELNDNSEKILKNFTDLISISTENEKTKIDLSKVNAYLEKHIEAIKKIEIYYDDVFTKIEGIEKCEKDGKSLCVIYKDLNDVTKKENSTPKSVQEK